MSALSQLPGAPAIGQLFPNFTKVQEAIEDWAIKEKFSFKVLDRDRTRVIYGCTTQGCQWRVRAHHTNQEDVKISILVPEHTCLPGNGGKRTSVAGSQVWLQRHIPKYLNITQATKPREIIDCLRIQFGEILEYKAVSRLKTNLLDNTLEGQREGFRQLPQYVNSILQANPNTYVRLSSDDATYRFRRIFICPAQSRSSFRSCRRFIAVDGTFLKTKFVQTLLLAVTIDANGKTLLLAWSIVESENASSWEYFLFNLLQAIPEMGSEGMTLMSDRDKGLVKASENLPVTIIRAYCCQHLKENLVTAHGRGLSNLFWAVARAPSVESFEAAMMKIQEVKQTAEVYLRNVDPTLWAKAYFPGKRYGHDTSNIVESVNSTLKLDRELSIVELLNAIWHKVMSQRFDRYQEAIGTGPAILYTKFCTQLLGESRVWARQNIALMADEFHGHVTQPNGEVKLVDLEQGICSCTLYQENGIPCGHALTCIMIRNQVCFSPLYFILLLLISY